MRVDCMGDGNTTGQLFMESPFNVETEGKDDIGQGRIKTENRAGAY